MSHKEEKNEYVLGDFSLEDILAEYGSARDQVLLRDVEEELRQEFAPVTKPQPQPEKQPEEELPPAPKPILLRDVVGETVDAVIEERREKKERKRKSAPLWKKRPSAPAVIVTQPVEEAEVETEEEASEPARERPVVRRQRRREPEWEEPEEAEEEPDLREAENDARRAYRRRSAETVPAVAAGLVPTLLYLAERLGAEIPFWSTDPKGQQVVLLAALAVTILLCRGVFAAAVSALVRRRCTSEVLAVSAAVVTLLDCAAALTLSGRSDVPAYAAAAALVMAVSQWSCCRRSRAMYDTMRTVIMDDEPPYLITETEKGACKQAGRLEGFYTTANTPPVTELWQTALLPVVWMAALVFAGLSSLGQGRSGDFLLNWSAMLCAGATLSMPLSWSFHWGKLARRLEKLGCALGAWRGAERLSRGRRILLSDTDLFPPGTVELNGVKVYGGAIEKANSYAASMVRRGGLGLQRIFDQQLRSEGGRCERVDEFSFYAEGGCSGVIHGESVVLGTATFLRKMDVEMPEEVRIKHGLFLGLDGRLAAVFALKYRPSPNVEYALGLLERCGVCPVLAARDPNLTPTQLRRWFGAKLRIETLPMEDRVHLAQAEALQPRALVLREGLMPYAEVVAGSRRLCRAVRFSGMMSILSSIIGVLLCFYLTFQGAYNLLTPLALVAFLALWTLPVLLSGQ